MRTTIIEDGVETDVPDYATVQGIFIGVVAAFIILITIVGPEYVHIALRPFQKLVDFTFSETTDPTSKRPKQPSRMVQDAKR